MHFDWYLIIDNNDDDDDMVKSLIFFLYIKCIPSAFITVLYLNGLSFLNQ